MRPKRPPLKASFLAPEARAEPIATTTACPDCKSTDVMFLLHPNTCELVQMLDHTMMKCGGCGGQFAADYVAALAALATKNPSGTISEDLICPECRNSIQGQRAGKPCRNCGNVILEHMAMSRRMARGINPWRIIIPSVAGILIVGSIYMFAPPPWGPASFVGAFALIEIWQGIHGMTTGRIEQRKGLTVKVHQGAKAVLISVFHLLLGVVAIGICWAILNGVFEKWK